VIKSHRSGFINQVFGVTSRSKTGVFTDEPIRGYEELMSLAADNDVVITFMDTTTLAVTLGMNTQIGFADVASITSSGNAIVS